MIDNVRNLHQNAPIRDELDDIKANAIRVYTSIWVRILSGDSADFLHGLFEVPMVTSVLEASDSQGTGKVIATSVNVTSAVSMIVVENTGADRFFLVRAL